MSYTCLLYIPYPGNLPYKPPYINNNKLHSVYTLFRGKYRVKIKKIRRTTVTLQAKTPSSEKLKKKKDIENNISEVAARLA